MSSKLTPVSPTPTHRQLSLPQVASPLPVVAWRQTSPQFRQGPVQSPRQHSQSWGQLLPARARPALQQSSQSQRQLYQPPQQPQPGPRTAAVPVPPVQMHQLPPDEQPASQERPLVAEVPPDVRQLLAAQLAAAEQILELGCKLESHLGLVREEGGLANGTPTRPGSTRLGSDRAGSKAPRSSDAHTVTAAPPWPPPVHESGGLMVPLLTGVQKAVQVSREISRTNSPRESDNGADTKAPHLNIFPDIDRLKEQAKEAIETSEYNVEDEYHTEGWFQEIARSKALKNVTCAMILLNAIWIGVDTDWNHAHALYFAAPVFQVAENVFCSFFTFEIVVRFCAFKVKRRVLSDGWFVFDATLVFLMVWETWILTAMLTFGMASTGIYGESGTASVFRMFRLLRLTRVLRIGRLLKEMPEFMMLARGMVIAMRSVFSTLVLMIIIIYVFAIVLVQLLSGTPAAPGCFENVPQAVNCLFLNSALSDQSAVLDKVLDQDLLTYLLALFYFIIGCLTLMNMLIGALCEVVSVVAREQSEALKVDACKEKLTVLLQEMDENSDCKISKDEFMNLMVNPEMVKMLVDLEVDIEAFIHSADVVCEQDVCDISTFVDIVMQFRSTNSATVKDLVTITKEMKAIRQTIEDKKAIAAR